MEDGINAMLRMITAICITMVLLDCSGGDGKNNNDSEKIRKFLAACEDATPSTESGHKTTVYLSDIPLKGRPLKIAISGSEADSPASNVDWCVLQQPSNSNLTAAQAGNSIDLTPMVAGEYSINAQFEVNGASDKRTVHFLVRNQLAYDAEQVKQYDNTIVKDPDPSVGIIENQLWVFSPARNQQSLEQLIAKQYPSLEPLKLGYDPVLGVLIGVEQLNQSQTDALESLRQLPDIRMFNRDATSSAVNIASIDSATLPEFCNPRTIPPAAHVIPAFGDGNWHLKEIDIVGAWNQLKTINTTDDFYIGVVDTQINEQHPDFHCNRFSQVTAPYRYVPGDEVEYGLAHGSLVTGAIAAFTNNVEGIAGIDQTHRIVAANFGEQQTRIDALISVLARDEKVLLVNASWGMIGDGISTTFDPGDDMQATQRFQFAVETTREFRALAQRYPDRLFISTAGNSIDHGSDIAKSKDEFCRLPLHGVDSKYQNGAIQYESPGMTYDALPNVIIVGAVDQDRRTVPEGEKQLRLAYYSGFGQSVDIAAPSHYKSTDAHNTYTDNFPGTSAAAPVVTGVASLVFTVSHQLTAAQVKTIMIKSARKTITERNLTREACGNDPVTTKAVPLVHAARAVTMATCIADNGMNMSKEITVPEVVSETDAENTLAALAMDDPAARLLLGSVTTQSHDTIAAGQVIVQDPPAGSTVNACEFVDLIVSSGPPEAAILTSTFDQDNEGWHVLTFPFRSYVAEPVIDPDQPIYESETASLLLLDYKSETGIAAPDPYLDAVTYGGRLVYDIFIEHSDNTVYPAVVLHNGDESVYFDRSAPTLLQWETFKIPLTETNWRSSKTGAEVTADEFKNILSRLTGLYIYTEWNSGPDRTHVDNIQLIPGQLTERSASLR